MSSSDTAATAAAGGGRPNPAAGKGERDTKRARATENAGAEALKSAQEDAAHDDEPSASAPHLTADIWALVMPSLTFRENVRCMRVSKMFLNDVTPRVKEISVMHSDEMKLKPARRFSGVKKVTIACLFADTGGLRDESGHYLDEFIESDNMDKRVDATVVTLAAPFASTFPSLEELRFVLFHDGVWKRWQSLLAIEGEDNVLLMNALELSFSGAYDSGIIPLNVKVRGCSTACSSGYFERSYCATCNRFLECFPPEAVITGRRYCCIPEKDRFQILAKRQEGKEWLESKEILLHLLRKPRLCPPFAEVAKEIGFVPAKMSREELLEWLPKLSASDENEIRRCYGVARESHVANLVSVGVPIKLDDFKIFV